MNKADKFLFWLCGMDVEFPYFKDMPEVALPDFYDGVDKAHQQDKDLKAQNNE